MFLHGGWDHILGNMLFLAIFGKNVEDAFGSLLYLVFYFAGGFAAMMTQTAMTLLFGTTAEARVPELGASGAIAAVLGAYFLLYPGSRIQTWIFPIFLVRIPAWIFLGLWFSYQLASLRPAASAHGGQALSAGAPERLATSGRPSSITPPKPGKRCRTQSSRRQQIRAILGQQGRGSSGDLTRLTPSTSR